MTICVNGRHETALAKARKGYRKMTGALGRRNWLFVANGNGGEIAAVVNSLVATCKDNQIDFEAWLADILPRLASTCVADIDTLLSHLWKTEQS